jgi:hypothetical protein
MGTERMEQEWQWLDDFERDGYQRVEIPVSTEEGVIFGQICAEAGKGAIGHDHQRHIGISR